MEDLQEGTFGGRLRRVGVLAWSCIGILVLLALVFRFVIYPIRPVYPPLALAVIVVYLLNPVVTRIAAGGRSRLMATLVVYIVFLGVSTAVLINVVPIVSRQVSDLLDHLPAYLDRAARSVNRFAASNGWSFRVEADEKAMIAWVESHRETVFGVLGRVRAFGEGVVRAVATFFLALVLSFYALVDLPKLRQGIADLVPKVRRAEVRELGEQIGKALGGFFRGQLLVAAFVGVASAVGLSLIDLPFALLVGLVAGIFNLVPLIGPFIGAVPAVFLGLFSGDPNKAWQAALVLLIVQQIDNHIVSPNVMGRTVKLHPITVMLALIAGAALAGIGGMVLVVPAVAAAKILLLYAWEHRGRYVSPAAPPAAAVPPE